VKDPLIMLYVGAREREAASLVLEAGRRLVYLPLEPMETLAMYATYLPDVAVLDAAADSAFVREVLPHLQSVGAPLVVLFEGEAQRRRWGPVDAPGLVVPAGLALTERLRAVEPLIERATTASGPVGCC